jgi:hypothetical protein
MGELTLSRKEKLLTTAVALAVIMVLGIIVPVGASVHASTPVRILIQSEREDLWTICFLMHVPRYGNCRTEQETTIRHSYSIYGFMSTVEIANSDALEGDDGDCCIRAELCRWEYRYYYCYEEIPGWGIEEWYESEWSMIQELNSWLNYDIHSTNQNTCEDDLEYFTWSGHHSVTFSSRYTGNDGGQEDNRYTGSWSYRHRDATYLQSFELNIGISVNVNGYEGYGSTSGFNYGYGSALRYVYGFGPNHYWKIDNLGSNNKVLAFKLVS